MGKKIKLFAGIVVACVCFYKGCLGQEMKCDSLYELAQVMPVYGTGPKDFFTYLNKNLEVKKPCKVAEIKRMIFTVNKNGKISDIEIVGINEKCREDLVRQLKTFPDWTPGKDSGRVVCVRVVLPIAMKERSKAEKEEEKAEKEQTAKEPKE